MGRFVLLAAAAVGLLLPSVAAASGIAADVRKAGKRLAAAVEEGDLSREQAAAHRATVARAARLVPRLPKARAGLLRSVLGQVAGFPRPYVAPRAHTLFAMVDANADLLANGPAPPVGRDVEGADGAVHRMVKGAGIQFHPLANAARLNGHLAAGRDVEAERLAGALVARAVPRAGGALVWEYPFRFWNVRPPWASGMAQAVIAQALARASERLGDPALLDAARAAARAIPRGLLLDLDGRPWVRLYEGLDLAVLNAQLQAALSLGDYAAIAGDAQAAGLAARLRESAAALLPRFDTGYWSLYSPGSESSLAYQRYVVSLLKRLGRETEEQVFVDAAARFAAYEAEPPVLRAGGAVPTLYPRPRDGHRDIAQVRFWISKPASVRLVVGGHTRRVVRVQGGWNTVAWKAPVTVPLGIHPAVVAAVGPAGNRAEVELPPIEVRRDREPPELSAAAGRTHLHWRAKDEGSDRLRLRLRLQAGGTRRTVDLGRRALGGSWRLRLPPGRWWGVLEATDASGNRARVALGRVS